MLGDRGSREYEVQRTPWPYAGSACDQETSSEDQTRESVTMRKHRPKRGESWIRLRTNEPVIVLAVVNPYGETPPYVVLQCGHKITTVKLERFHKDYKMRIS